MRQKIVLSTDWHLKFHSPFDRPTEEGLSSRLMEIITSVRWVMEQGKANNAQYFIGLGDIFDHADSLLTKEGLAIKTLFSDISKKFNKKAYFIPGNHDSISANHNILNLFSDTISVFSEMSFVDISGARLFFLPYIRESEDVYAQINKMKTLDCLGKKYLFAHFWDSSKMGHDPEAINLSKIDLSFFDRIFLGHHHVPSINKKEKVVYLGTLLNKTFSETGTKGCCILDVEKNEIEFIANPHSPEFFTVQDNNVLGNAETLLENAYYRVACDPENVVEINKLLSRVKGFEIISKQADSNDPTNVSIMNVDKKNSHSAKDYFLKNCNLFCPDGIEQKTFKEAGELFLAGL